MQNMAFTLLINVKMSKKNMQKLEAYIKVTEEI